MDFLLAMLVVFIWDPCRKMGRLSVKSKFEEDNDSNSLPFKNKEFRSHTNSKRKFKNLKQVLSLMKANPSSSNITTCRESINI